MDERLFWKLSWPCNDCGDFWMESTLLEFDGICPNCATENLDEIEMYYPTEEDYREDF